MKFKIADVDYTESVIGRSLRRGRLVITLEDSQKTRPLFLDIFAPKQILYRDEDMFLSGDHDFDVFMSRDVYWDAEFDHIERSRDAITLIIYWGLENKK